MTVRSTTGTVIVTEKAGDIDIRCTRDPVSGRIALHIDSDENLGCLRVQIYGPSGDLMVERLVRSLPGSLSFAAPDNGRYDITVRPLAGVGANQGKCLTWSDWGQMMGGSGGKGGQQGCTTTAVVGDATLMVA